MTRCLHGLTKKELMKNQLVDQLLKKRLFFLPPNVTASIHPMDQGVVESVKRRYRRELLKSLSEEDGKNASAIDLLKRINIKYVVYMIAESWLELPESTLVKSWQKNCQNVEQWLAIDKDLQQEILSDEDIFGAVIDVVQDDEDGDDIIENPTSLISNTDGTKASESALCDMEKQSSASPIEVMLIKNGETMLQVAELLGFNKKKITHFFNGM
ncbi:hypothetical protein AVEN_11527-1 [Araneus ventricosus]|uniref:DDE-1 domain-containing protein n=1 Tax=Araneus ventricosus TaxID=182803 RepID=A0A4Y2GYM5_ARAVE|nr:hypothetical protein AVEN_11527-1 [Araneus ventricosus]